MPRQKMTASLGFRRAPIADALAILKEMAHRGATHVRMTVSTWEDVPPKAKAPKHSPLASNEPARPGKIRPHGREGTVRQFRESAE